MADPTQSVTITMEPAYVDPSLIISPRARVPDVPSKVFPSILLGDAPRSLAFNIETMGLKPWNERIITIGYQDVDAPENVPTIIMLDNEADMIRAFMNVLVEGEYTRLVGYGLGFDYRYILLRAMFHNIPIEQFMSQDLYDLMEFMAKGKREFVYKAQQPPKLSELGDFFWNYPKPFSDLDNIKYYAEGRFDLVRNFASGQIDRIILLYYLFRLTSETSYTVGFISSESEGLSANTPPQVNSNSKLTNPSDISTDTIAINCDVCLTPNFVPPGTREQACSVCNRQLTIPGG